MGPKLCVAPAGHGIESELGGHPSRRSIEVAGCVDDVIDARTSRLPEAVARHRPEKPAPLR